jgi:cation diffusion facilitator family transporter
LSAGLRVTWVGAVVNLLLIALKLWAGTVSRSQALVADGIHSISDLFSDAVVFLGLRWGRKEADADHHFGHARIETSASLIIGLLLMLVAVWIAASAILGIYHHRQSNPGLLAITVALISVLLKEGMYWYTIIVGKRIRSQALVGNAWHHRTDAFSSVAVLIGVVAAYINPDWHIADSIAALVVSIFILKVGSSLAWSAFREVVDTAPDAKVLEELKLKAQAVPGVGNVHGLRARHFGPEIYVELHLSVDPNLTVAQGHDIAEAVERTLIDSLDDVSRVITHVEPDSSDAKEDDD